MNPGGFRSASHPAIAPGFLLASGKTAVVAILRKRTQAKPDCKSIIRRMRAGRPHPKGRESLRLLFPDLAGKKWIITD